MLSTLPAPPLPKASSPGGGTAYIRCLPALDDIEASEEEMAGVNIVRRAVEEPLRQIAANAGFEGSVVVEKVREGKGGFGFNAATGEYRRPSRLPVSSTPSRFPVLLCSMPLPWPLSC